MRRLPKSPAARFPRRNAHGVGRFGNYIVQRVIALAQLPQRDMLFAKLREHMPVLKKSNTCLAVIVSKPWNKSSLTLSPKLVPKPPPAIFCCSCQKGFFGESSPRRYGKHIISAMERAQAGVKD